MQIVRYCNVEHKNEKSISTQVFPSAPRTMHRSSCNAVLRVHVHSLGYVSATFSRVPIWIEPGAPKRDGARFLSKDMHTNCAELFKCITVFDVCWRAFSIFGKPSFYNIIKLKSSHLMRADAMRQLSQCVGSGLGCPEQRHWNFNKTVISPIYAWNTAWTHWPLYEHYALSM